MKRIMEKIKVSVIIPVYNVENYIEECVESVINQTLKEIEIIIVNDGTKDNSIKKIEKYLSNPRVILINKENGGVSSARNAGLEIARGEYISFVDSDDFIELTMLEDLYNESKGMDIVFSNFARIDSLENNIKIEKNNFKNLEIKEGSYFYNIELGYVVNRIYNHEFLKKFNIKFKENMLMEDLLFSLKVFSIAKKVKYLDKVHYYYRIDINSSIVNTLIKNKELMNKTYNQLIEEVEKFLIEFEGKKFIKLRIFLTKIDLFVRKKKLNNEKINNKKIKEIEEKIENLWDENFSIEENKILREDMFSILKGKVFLDIDLLKKFYWKNGLITKKYLRRVLEFKLKKVVKKLF